VEQVEVNKGRIGLEDRRFLRKENGAKKNARGK